jgi:tRNA threonylcarbamoyl adenosine modification protein YeaZ
VAAAAAHGPAALAISASGGSYCCVLDVPGRERLRAAREDELAATVAELFDAAGLAPSALQQVRLDVGPGSYTGLRVAVTWARTLQAFADVELWAATSLELMALHAWRRAAVPDDTPIRPVLDARRHRYHHAQVRLGETATLTAPPRAVELGELIGAIEGQETLLVEPTIRSSLVEVAAQRGCRLLPAPTDAGLELAELLFDPRLRARRVAVEEDLQPLYSMGTYADA